MTDSLHPGLRGRPVVFGGLRGRAGIAGVVLFALVAGCASQPAARPPVAAPAAPAPLAVVQAPDEDDDDDMPVERPAPRASRNLPDQELTPDILYEFLVAEIGLQRGNAPASAREYVDLAKRTRDPRIARRATDLSRRVGDVALARQAAQVWAEVEPESMEAVGQYAGFLILEGRTDEALPWLKRLLTQPGANAEQRIAQIGQLLAQTPDKQATLRVMRELAKEYPKDPRAHLEVARAAYNANDDALALEKARIAQQLRPGWELAALTEAQILQRKSPAEASAALEAFLKQYPKSADVRLQYARALVAERKYPAARAEFQKLLADFPDNSDVVFAVAVLSMQQEDWPLAEANLKRLVDMPVRDKNVIYLYLGQIAEEQKRYSEAIGWYEKVGPSEQYLSAQIRRANVAAKQGDVAKGRAMIAEARGKLNDSSNANSQQRVALVLAEAQILREANRPKEAMDVVGKALDTLPNQPDLLYDYAMIAERLDQVDLMESTLRKLIQIKPDHAHAYNALGYSLADRDMRLPEAKQLIEKALAIEPDNAMIVDSMGWVLYRMGDLQGSEKYLAKAYEGSRRDPEVAAHYGEVLWQLGRKKEADAIWNEALGKSPTNETLLKTIQRLKP